MRYIRVIKAIIFILPILFADCSEDLEGYMVNGNYLKIDNTDNGVLSFSDDVTSHSVTITSKGTWNITSKPEWLDVSPSSGDGTTMVSVKVIDYPQSNVQVNDTLYIQLGNLTSKIQVSRAPYKFVVSPTNELTFGAQDDSRLELSIDCYANTKWSISTQNKSNWCLVSEQSGKGDKKIYVSCNKNNTDQERRDTLLIKTNWDTIPVPVYQSNSTFFIKSSVPGGLVYSVDGGTQAFTVYTNINIEEITVLPKNNYGIATIVQDSHNKNNFNVSVGENTTAEMRFDTIYIAAVNIPNVKDSVLISQTGQSPVLEVTPNSLSSKPLQFGSDAGSSGFSIESNLNWTLTCDKEEWCHITSSKSGTGNGTVKISVDQNPLGATARDAVITITTSSLTKTVKIHQAAGEEPYIKIVKNSQEISSLENENTGGTNSFTVDSNVDWSITCSDDSWCHIETLEGTGAGTKNVKITVDLNPVGSAERNSSITVRSTSYTNVVKVVNVHQKPGEKEVLNILPLSLETSPRLDYKNTGGTQSFKVQSNIDWSISCSNNTWCHIETPDGTGIGTKDINVAVDVNPAESDGRNCVISISSSLGKKEITVYQDPGDEGYVRVVKDGMVTNKLSAKPQGETLTFNIESNLSNWTVSSNKDWCVVNPPSGSFNATVSLVVGLNSSSEARDAILTIKSKISDVTLTIHQEPKAIPGGDDNPDPSYSRKR